MDSLSYINHSVSESLQYKTLRHLAEIAAQNYANNVAIDSVEQEAKLTYLEVLREADKFSVGLRKLGLEKGDYLGLWSPNCVEWYIAQLASVRMGLIVVLLNTATGASEMEDVINRIGIKFIVCPYGGKHNNYYKVLMDLAPELKETKTRDFTSCHLPSLKGMILISDKNITNTYSYSEVLNIGMQNISNDEQQCRSIIDPDDICYIHLSSGTTGKPKIIPITHFQAFNSSYLLAKRLQFDQKHHTVCIQNPLFHLFGTVMAICTASHFGTTLVLPSKYYNSTRNLDVISKRKCSFVYGTPTMFIDLIGIQEQINTDLDVEGALVAGSPYTPNLLRNMRSVLGIKTIKVGYGLTETTGCVFISRPGEEPHDDIVGYPLEHTEIKIMDQTGETLPTGHRGEICVRGYCVMMGYLNDKQTTKKAIQSSGWLRTGDIGILQSTGHAKVVGRIDDLIIRGGVNIYPKEIEDVLTTLPDIVEAQVLGIPHSRLGEEVCACIKLKVGCNLSILEVAEFCVNRISSYKIPTKLKIIEEFPKTVTGKVQKNVLRERICNSHLRGN